MSYFDDNTGGDASDDVHKNNGSGSDMESDTETIDDEVAVEDDEEEEEEEVDEEEVDDEDDVAAKGQDYPSDDEYGDADAIKQKEPGNDEDYEEIEVIEKTAKTKIKKIPTKQKAQTSVYDEEDEDEEDPTGEVYLQKFDKEINDNYLVNLHPESAMHNYDEILAMTKVVRDKTGIIIDDLHKTIPFLTKYEKARILGQRAKQINSGATVFVKVPEKVIDGYLIAELELIEKRVPFIIRRPLPNGGSEYWSIKDLENISF